MDDGQPDAGGIDRTHHQRGGRRGGSAPAAGGGRVAGLCTDDVAAGRRLAAQVFAVYGGLPSYRAMLDREGLGDPNEIAVVGDEASVREQLEAVFAAGATDVLAAEFGSSPEDLARTRVCLASLL
ncbi:MAG: 5,10-methylenetetrahydromethanopterin reductase [Acidimicrobiia bacterium]|nr:5,10-methylenetetrahydromethanopterin reductase [Acidimicrobiia bacterium]